VTVSFIRSLSYAVSSRESVILRFRRSIRFRQDALYSCLCSARTCTLASSQFIQHSVSDGQGAT
jgi:hypothetical protein